ncbi:MAG TPA: HAD-IB family hydrolase [Spirochaetota bacterium]|nr:HAD-IB family hydrolase [Spirochaetota bacterium]
MKKIALFDVDLTITKSDTFFLFIPFIISKYPYKLIFIPYLLFVSFLKLIRVVSMEFFKQSWLIFINGLNINKIENLSKEFFEKKVKSHLKSDIIEYINKLKNDGYTIVFATASFEFYIKYLSEYLNADYYFGTKVLFKDNKIISRIVGKNCKRQEKIYRILSVINSEDIDRKNSIGFSDSLVDLPFLEIVDRFYLVHPKKWQIIDSKIKSS